MSLSAETLRAALGWSALINCAVLALWYLMFATLREPLRRLHNRVMRLPDGGELSATTFTAIHYGGMGLFKLGIFVFNLTPFVALSIAM